MSLRALLLRLALSVIALAGSPLRTTAQEVPPPAAQAPASAPTATTPPADDAAQGVSWTLVVKAPDRVRELLLRYLELARFQHGDGDITRAELSRLAAAAPAQARSLLETEGYFEPKIGISLATEDPPTVVLEVEPGPRATIAALSLKVEGDLQTRAEAGDVDARELQRRVGAAWPLQPGTPFGQADWSAAKSAVLVQLRAAGYPLAAWTSTAAEVDAAQHSVAITAVADSGPRFHFGELRIEGLSRYDESAIRNLAPFDPGTPYSEQALLDFQERIAKAGLFDSVAVTLEPDAAQASAAPVLVRVRELPKQQATVGVGYSMESGPRLSFEHLQRRPFGLDWQAKTKLQLGRNQSSLSLDLTSHPLPGLYRNLLSGSYTHEVASGVTTNSQQYRVGRTQDTDAIERLYYFEWQHAAINSDGVDSSSTAATLNYEWVWRRLDSNLLPTRGISASAKVGAGRAFQAAGDLQLNAGWFSRASGRVTGYLPLGAQWFGQARLEGAQVFSGPDVAVPYTLLFRAGGDNSVRGYGYQSLGPNNQDGTPAGGHVLATSSIELARPISPKRPAWLGAVFVDAGDAAIDWRSLRPALGYGVGARWRSPAGLLSLDLAYGQRTRKFRLHFNVGVVF